MSILGFLVRQTRVEASPFVLVLVGADREKGVREHRQGDVPIPGVIEPDLIVIQTDTAFGGFETFLDRPPGARNTDQVTEPFGTRIVAMIEGQFTVIDRTADQILVVGRVRIQQCPVIDAEPLGADPAGATLPGVRSQEPDPFIDPRPPSDRVGELSVFRDGHHVRDPGVLQMSPQSGILAELLVRGEPGEGQATLTDPVHHRGDLLRPCLERQILRDAGFGASLLIVAPRLFRDVQLAVDQDPFPRAGRYARNVPI